MINRPNHPRSLVLLDALRWGNNCYPCLNRMIDKSIYVTFHFFRGHTQQNLDGSSMHRTEMCCVATLSRHSPHSILPSLCVLWLGSSWTWRSRRGKESLSPCQIQCFRFQLGKSSEKSKRVSAEDCILALKIQAKTSEHGLSVLNHYSDNNTRLHSAIKTSILRHSMQRFSSTSGSSFWALSLWKLRADFCFVRDRHYAI